MDENISSSHYMALCPMSVVDMIWRLLSSFSNNTLHTCGRYTDLVLDMIANRLTADQVCSALDLCQVRVASQGF
jgi:hypothetical protein